MVKPAKHVTLGMAIKSITGSRKLVDVFNRFEHCLNCTALEELKTATAEALLARKKACPPNTAVSLSLGLPFDNFDELTQTSSGADTLHDTMGILDQNMPMDSVEQYRTREAEIQDSGEAQEDRYKGQKKRTLDVPDVPLGLIRY